MLHIYFVYFPWHRHQLGPPALSVFSPTSYVTNLSDCHMVKSVVISNVPHSIKLV